MAGATNRPLGRPGKIAGRRRARLADQGDGETVVALAADGLDRRRLDPRLGGEHLVEATLGDDRRVFIRLVDQGSAPTTLSATISPPGRVCSTDHSK